MLRKYKQRKIALIWKNNTFKKEKKKKISSYILLKIVQTNDVGGKNKLNKSNKKNI